MRVRTRILLGYSPSLLILLGLIGYNVWSGKLADDEAIRVNEKTLPAVVASEELLSLARNLESLEYTYFVTQPIPGHSPQQAMAAFDQASSDFDRYFTAAQQAADSPAELHYLHNIDQAYGAFEDIDHRMRILIRQGRVSEAERLNFSESLTAFERFSRAANELATYNRDLQQRVRVDNEARRHQNRLVAIIGAIIALLLSILAGLWLARSISKPLAELEEDAERIARGDFELPAASSELAEISELASVYDAVSRMSRSLESLTQGFKKANSQLESQVFERTAALEEAKRQLEGTVAELRSLDKLKSDFLSVVSHELLTPINFMTGYGSALEDGTFGELTPAQAQAASRILEGATRLTRIVRNLLDFTKLESGTLAIKPELVSLADVVATLKDEYLSLALTKDQQLTFAMEEIGPVCGDPSRLQQVLGELLDNALKFTGNRGRIQVRVAQEGDRALLEVSDTGIGIDPGVLPHVFERFYQGDSSSTRAYGGTGIGLTLARHLIERMGGTIAIESEVGRGTRVRIHLPVDGSCG